jgi:hypothetical protein
MLILVILHVFKHLSVIDMISYFRHLSCIKSSFTRLYGYAAKACRLLIPVATNFLTKNIRLVRMRTAIDRFSSNGARTTTKIKIAMDTQQTATSQKEGIRSK